MKPRAFSPPPGSKGRGGYTLIQLMAVVVIIGILATIAVSTLKGNIDKVYISEASMTLATIMQRAKIRKLDSQKYIQADPNPSDTEFRQKICQGGEGIWNTATKGWQELGFHPGKPGVRFQYYTRTGDQLSTLSGQLNTCYGLIRASVHFPPGSTEQWMTACARGDLRRASTCSPSDPAIVLGISSSDTLQRVLVNDKRK